MRIKDLQQEEAQISEAIASLKAELAESGGEQYQGCWLDSTQDRTGKKTYTRLRWFIDVAAKKKGCRTLKGGELARVTRVIELWAALAQYEAELARTGEAIRRAEEEIAIVEALARGIGWAPPPEKPTRKSRSKRGDRHSAKLEMRSGAPESPQDDADVQTIPDGTQVKTPKGWKAEILSYLGNGRYQIKFLDGLTGQTDDYPRHLLKICE